MSTIDLSKLPFPNVIEALNAETFIADFISKFTTTWDEERQKDATLPAYDVETLEFDPVVIVGQVISFFRLLDRQRVNDAAKSLLAPFAEKSDLDNIVARQGVSRLDGETDLRLLLRYLLSFDRESAGSSKLLKYLAYTAWSEIHHVETVGHAHHGRKGDTDVVISTIDGTAPSNEIYRQIYSDVTAEDRKPEAMGVFLHVAEALSYNVSFRVEVPSGPDWELIRSEAIKRVQNAALLRTQIGATVPVSYLQAAVFQDDNMINVEEVGDLQSISATKYQIPILGNVSIILPGE